MMTYIFFSLLDQELILDRMVSCVNCVMVINK